MIHLFITLGLSAILFVLGAIGEAVAVALGYLDPWDFR